MIAAVAPEAVHDKFVADDKKRVSWVPGSPSSLQSTECLTGTAVPSPPSPQAKSVSSATALSEAWSADPSPSNQKPVEQPVLSLSQLPFTRDIDLSTLSHVDSHNSSPRVAGDRGSGARAAGSFCLQPPLGASLPEEDYGVEAAGRRTTTASSNIGGCCTYKVAESRVANVWRRTPLPESLATAQRGRGKQYPNTPLSMAWYEEGSDCFLFVGLIYSPTLLKICPPKLHEPDKGGRFNVLPIDARRVLLADEGCNQIWLVNFGAKTKRHLAGCGKRGFLDGPLEVCSMHSPCSMTLDPHNHHIYIADKGNHVIRKVDVLTGLMSTVCGSGSRGNYDSSDRRRQALDSPFEVSFSEPHFLVISCADNSVRCFDLKTGYLDTLLVGS